jgi:hypothetical protein
MSDLLGLHLYFHVLTPDGDVYVSDSRDGDRALRALVAQYPGATVIPTDRATGKALCSELPLLRLLQQERGFVSLDAQPGVKP